MPFSHCGFLIPRIGDDPIVASAWERFVRDAVVPRSGVRDVVVDSWQRCQSQAVNPGSSSAPGTSRALFRHLTQQNCDLCEAAEPVLESLSGVLRECGSLIILSDAHGTILQLVGENRIRSAGEGINLAVGGQWDEKLIGTNAIGTAIALSAPVQIYASEHFCHDVKRWTCAAAPVRDPLSRALLGVIDVSGIKESFHGHSLGLVIAAARQFESEIARREFIRQGRLLNRAIELFARYASDGLVLCDRRGRVIRTGGTFRAPPLIPGLSGPLVIGRRIDQLSFNETGAIPLASPGWLRPEWLLPVRDGDETLGTLLVIPAPASRRAEPHVAAQAGAAPPVVDDSAEDPFAVILGGSEALQVAKARARRIAKLDLPVLLEGETGVGKELFARALHRSGRAPAGPFVAFNCGALTRALLASELFGYVEGAFTGARRGGLAGKFEQADGGTLFLDEIGEMPLDMQPNLLRVLQDGIVVRLGDTRERHICVRLISATNKDLRQEVIEGRFREDLYHRLCAVNIVLPPLRDRPGDIETIIEYLNLSLARKYGCLPKTWDTSLMQALCRYSWPGNIRELQNAFELAFALSEGQVLDRAALPSVIVDGVAREAPRVTSPSPSGRLADVEAQAIFDGIEKSHHNMAAAARLLGISRSTLYVKWANIRRNNGLE